MQKDTIRRASRLLLTVGLCMGMLTSIGAVDEAEEPIPPAPPEAAADKPAEPARPAEPTSTAEDIARQARIAELLSEMDLNWEQLRALIARLGEDASLLQLLEQGELTRADLVYLVLPNGLSDRLDRYSAWAANYPEIDAKTVVLQVNMDRDQAFYSQIQEIADPSSLTVLVNKHYVLSAGYVPELEVLGSRYGSGSLRPEAAAAFRAMADAARADGISLRSVSAYRSYNTQKSLYNNYLKQYKRATVDTFSARPGHSEHQTGLALDINVARTSAHFENTAAFAWLKAHCAEYGFILRYDQGQEAITGFRFEPWHYRYVGQEIASAVMSWGISYEEYVALHGVWGVHNG